MNPEKPRSRHAQVRAVSQVALTVAARDATETFGALREEALRWIARRAGRPLPKEAWAGQAFDLQDVGAQRTAATALKSPVYWAARLDDADKAVAQRTWITEIGIGVRAPDEVLFGCRLYCVALGDNPPYQASIPGFVRQISEHFPSRLDGRQVSDVPWHVGSEVEADELVMLLYSASRKHPVLVVSEGRLPGEYSINARTLARSVLGVAHVVQLSSSASFRLTDDLGKEFSVFDGAVRTYRPGFDPDADEPSSHPLAFASSILQWDGAGPHAFEDFLAQQAIFQSVSRRDLELEVPSFSSVLRHAAHEVRSNAQRDGQSDSQLLALAMDEIQQLEERAEEERRTFEGLLLEAERERDASRAAADGARGEAANLRSRIAHLEHALASAEPAGPVPLPESFDELGDWVGTHLAGSVVVLNRALRAAKKSDLENPALAYKALLVLRDYYVPMRRLGEARHREEYDRQISALGLEESASFAGSRAGEQGDEYFVDYQGRRRELDRHLKGSSSRDVRFGFRLYFFWDEDTQQVVVGSLPTHLSTRAS